MAPVPLEGIQTSMTTAVGMLNQGTLGGAPDGNRGGMISLAKLIDFIVQRTYHELTVLAELLPRKTDMERKLEIFTFAMRTRQLFIRLMALVKWANSASKVEKSARIMGFLDKQSMLFVETADMLSRVARETLVQARLPNFHIPAAVEVLTTGTFGRLPSCIRERIVPPDPITNAEKRTTLLRLNQVIQHRLVTGNLQPQMKNLKIENGRVTFHVQHEFEVSLTLMGDGPNIPWRLLEITILVADKETGEGKPLVHPLQIQYIHQLVQARLVDNTNPLTEVYNCLHFFCQSLQLEVLYTQTLRLMRDRLDDHIHVDVYTPGRCLTVSYWRELTSRSASGTVASLTTTTTTTQGLPTPSSVVQSSSSSHLRCLELGYKLTVQVDGHDAARHLAVLHVPSLGGAKELEIADRAIRTEVLSMERLLVHTIYVRTRARLNDIKLELQSILAPVECSLQGSPAVLSVAILQPCLRAEQLLITVDTHTGWLQCHVPQYEAAPLMPELNAALNAADHAARLLPLISELRYWITQRRCEKTLQHLPASAHEKLPLLHHADHPLTRIDRHRMYVQLHRHPNVILVVELKEKDSNPCEIDCNFHMAVVKRSSIEDNPVDDSVVADIPKVYLKVQNLIEFDTFLITHGAYTAVDVLASDGPLTAATDPNSSSDSGQSMTSSSLKRKQRSNDTVSSKEGSMRRAKQPAYFIAELAHAVAVCDERLPFVNLANELTRRQIYHQGVQVEANASGLVLRIIQMPPPSPEIGRLISWRSLTKRLLSVSIRCLSKGILKSWMVEYVFYSSPLASLHPKEQSCRRAVYFQYEVALLETTRTVEQLLSDWSQIVHLYLLMHDLSEMLRSDRHSLNAMFNVKSYSYSKLVLCYGTEKGALVSIAWCAQRAIFRLAFGTTHNALNAHSLIKEQLESHLNGTLSLAQLIQLLHETYEPLISISKLPTLPQLGIYNTRPQVPVQTFTIMPQSVTLVRLAYQDMYCLELRIRGGNLVSLRDGAYSRFDRTNVVDVFSPTQGLKAFLSKYVDESTLYRRRSQSEDDNPPSPIMTLDMDSGGVTGFLGTGGVHHSRGGSSGPQSPASSGLRFHPPLTPPSISNPHTPASPLTAANIGPAAAAAAAAAFSLSSPTPGGAAINPSPGGGLVANNSPMNPQMPSPGGGPTTATTVTSLSNSSPGSQQMSLAGHSPVSSSFLHADGSTNSPFPPTQQQQQQQQQQQHSPGAAAWPGSPSMPRPSPAGRPPGQSPGFIGMHDSPQSGGVGEGLRVGPGHMSSLRVLPQRSWAGAVPTLLTHEALETLCCPTMHPQGLPGPEMAPLERFLGCVYMRRQLQRYIHSEASLTPIPNPEPGVIHFKVGEAFQCRIGLNAQHMQSLHLKITPLMMGGGGVDHSKEVLWCAEELQILERFFETRAAAPPYKPTAMFTFCTMLNTPLNVLKDFIQIMKLDLMTTLQQQQSGMKWSVQWILRIPPLATPIVPTGMSGVLVHRSKILFFLQIRRTQTQHYDEPLTLVLPFIYDINTNLTQLAEKRESVTVPGMTAAIQLLKHFAQFQPAMSECSIFPALRELLLNLVLPSDQQQQQQVPPQQQMSMPQQGGPGGGPQGPPQPPPQSQQSSVVVGGGGGMVGIPPQMQQMAPPPPQPGGPYPVGMPPMGMMGPQ